MTKKKARKGPGCRKDLRKHTKPYKKHQLKERVRWTRLRTTRRAERLPRGEVTS